MSFSFALSESRRLFLRSLSVRSLASAVSEPRQFFVACEDCTARFALSLLWRLDNRVSSSSALSEARRIFLRYLYARVVVELELRYVQRPLYRKIAARCTTRSRSPIMLCRNSREVTLLCLKLVLLCPKLASCTPSRSHVRTCTCTYVYVCICTYVRTILCTG